MFTKNILLAAVAGIGLVLPAETPLVLPGTNVDWNVDSYFAEGGAGFGFLKSAVPNGLSLLVESASEPEVNLVYADGTVADPRVPTIPTAEGYFSEAFDFSAVTQDYVRVEISPSVEESPLISVMAAPVVIPTRSRDTSRIGALEPDETISVVNLQPGLISEYFSGYDTGVSYEQVPEFDSLMPRYVTLTPNLSFASSLNVWPGLPDSYYYYSNFASRHAGYIVIPTTGDYTIHLRSDDGSYLKLDGVPLIDNDGRHVSQEVDAAVRLIAGVHSIEVGHFDFDNYAELVLSWTGPGFEKETVPANVLFHSPSGMLPVVSVTAPKSGALFAPGESVQLSATANDFDGIVERVEFLVDGSVVAVSTGETYAAACELTGPGDHVVAARAYDDSGNARMSVPVSVSVPDPPEFFAFGMEASYSILDRYLQSVPDFAEYDFTGNSVIPNLTSEVFPSSLATHFLARYRAFVWVRSAGSYSFALNTDGPSELYVLGKKVVARSGYAQGPTTSSPSVYLKPGCLPLEVRCLKRAGNHIANLYWNDGSGSRLMPPASLLHVADNRDTDGDGMPDWWERYYGLSDTAAQPPGYDTDADGLSDLDEYLAGTSPVVSDTDEDGVPDAWEVAHGTFPAYPNAREDSDGDGLCTLEEYRANADPWSADTDGDGISDYDEWLCLGTDPASPDAVAVGSASPAESSGRAFVVEVDTPKPFAVSASLVHEWRDYARNKRPEATTCRLVFRVDGHFVAYNDVPFDSAGMTHAVFYTPVLPAGAHQISINRCSPDFRARTVIAGLSVNELEGIDCRAVVEHRNAIPDTSISSRVSPACVEAESRFPWLVSAGDVAVRPSGIESWYADIPLSATSDTVVTVSFEGLVSTNLVVSWERTELFAGAADVVLRRGDSLLFGGCPEGRAEGAVSVFTNGVLACSYPAGGSCPLEFSSDGESIVQAVWHDRDLPDEVSSPAIRVSCRGGAFPSVRPACLVGVSRSWSCPELSPELTFTTDAFTRFSVAEGGRASLLVEDTRGDRIVAARLSEGGPVLDAVQVDPLWAVESYGNVSYLLDSSAEYDRCRCYIRQYGASGSVRFRLSAYTSGVLFEDLMTERWLEPASFDEEGVAWFEINKLNSMASPCHSVEVYDGSVRLGEAVYGNGKLPEELR